MQERWYVGVALDGVATLAGAFGKQLLRYAAVKQNGWYYVLGLCCTAIVDPAFDLAAYSFAAQSIIAACAWLTVAWNVLLAPCVLGETLTPSRISGAVLIFAGTVLIGLFGNHVEVERTPSEYLTLFTRPMALAYYCAFAAWGLLCVWLHSRAPDGAGAVFFCAFGGSLAGNSFSTKAAVELTECVAADAGCPVSPFASPLFFVYAGVSLLVAVASLSILALTLRRFEALYMISVYQGFFVVAGAISGNFVMDEKAGQSWPRLCAYSASIGVVLVGLSVLVRGELDGERGRGRAVL
jgi:uncharacterized membrane protein